MPQIIESDELKELVNDNWFVYCNHTDGMLETVRLGQVKGKNKPRHRSDFKADEKYIINSNKWSGDSGKYWHYKVYIGRMAATEAELEASLWRKRVRWPKPDIRDSDALGTELDQDESTKKKQTSAELEQKKRKAAAPDLARMSHFVEAIRADGGDSTPKRTKTSDSKRIKNGSNPCPSHINSDKSNASEVGRSCQNSGSPSKSCQAVYSNSEVIRPKSANISLHSYASTSSPKSIISRVLISSPTITAPTSPATFKEAYNLNSLDFCADALSETDFVSGVNEMSCSQIPTIMSFDDSDYFPSEVGQSSQGITFLRQTSSGTIEKISPEDPQKKVEELSRELQKFKELYYQSQSQQVDSSNGISTIISKLDNIEERLKKLESYKVETIQQLEALMPRFESLESKFSDFLADQRASTATSSTRTSHGSVPRSSGASPMPQQVPDKVDVGPGIQCSTQAMRTLDSSANLREWLRALLLGCFSRTEAKVRRYRVQTKFSDHLKEFGSAFENYAKVKYEEFLIRNGQQEPVPPKEINKVLGMLSKVARDLGGRRNKASAKVDSGDESGHEEEYRDDHKDFVQYLYEN